MFYDRTFFFFNGGFFMMEPCDVYCTVCSNMNSFSRMYALRPVWYNHSVIFNKTEEWRNHRHKSNPVISNSKCTMNQPTDHVDAWNRSGYLTFSSRAGSNRSPSHSSVSVLFFWFTQLIYIKHLDGIQVAIPKPVEHVKISWNTTQKNKTKTQKKKLKYNLRQ